MEICLVNPCRICQDRAHVISTEPLHIGRGPSNHIRLCNFHISRHHCKVWKEGDQAFVQDCNSRNGTRVDHSYLRAGEVTLLSTGSTLYICDIQFKVMELEIPWDILDNELVHNLALAIDQMDDWCALPVLGDALEEAGCTDEAILSHCHDDPWHSRGCWVVEMILRRPFQPDPEAALQLMPSRIIS